MIIRLVQSVGGVVFHRRVTVEARPQVGDEVLVDPLHTLTVARVAVVVQPGGIGVRPPAAVVIGRDLCGYPLVAPGSVAMRLMHEEAAVLMKRLIDSGWEQGLPPTDAVF